MKKNSKADDFIKISGGILETLENAKDYLGNNCPVFL